MTNEEMEEILGFVQANIDELISRKREMEKTMRPLPDIAWQYADGLVNGAREIKASLFKKFTAHVHCECPDRYCCKPDCTSPPGTQVKPI